MMIDVVVVSAICLVLVSTGPFRAVFPSLIPLLSKACHADELPSWMISRFPAEILGGDRRCKAEKPGLPEVDFSMSTAMALATCARRQQATFAPCPLHSEK